MFVAGALSALTTTPQNVITEAGNNVDMQCSTDQATNTITWNHDSDLVVNTPCAVTGAFTASYTVTSPVANSDCYITGLGTAAGGNYGPYICGDGTATLSTEAVAVLIGIQLLSYCIYEINLLIFFFFLFCSSSRFYLSIHNNSLDTYHTYSIFQNTHVFNSFYFSYVNDI